MKSDIEKIQKQIKEWSKENLNSRVEINTVQGNIFISISGTSKKAKEILINSKIKLQDFVLDNFPHRTWTHKRSNGYTMWNWYVGNQLEGKKVGLKIKREEFELNAIIQGPEAWHAIQE